MYHAHSHLAPLTARWRAYAWTRRAARSGIVLIVSAVAFTFAMLERILAGTRRAFDWLLWRLGYARVELTREPYRGAAAAAPYPGAQPHAQPPQPWVPPVGTAPTGARVPPRPIPMPPPLPEPDSSPDVSESTQDFEDEAPTTLYMETDTVEGTVVEGPWSSTLNVAKTRVMN